jgi:cell division cycle 2-like protein
MEFVEHDLKSLMASMRAPFLQSEIKTLMLQLLSVMSHLHANWVIHRDLKTSNLLFNNRGQIKVADFGLARKFSSPLHPMTVPVVTCWYRSPELLLGTKEYTTAVDMWSVGCIFGELLTNEPILQGQGELDQLDKIFKLLGLPNDDVWPEYKQLPLCQSVTFHGPSYDTLRNKFPYITESSMDLLKRLLCYDPKQRISALDALDHPYFSEHPPPKDEAHFPTWPSKASRDI